MKYAIHYLRTAVAFINEYDGKVPLSTYLKIRFSTDKKYGSKDRKNIAALCYCHFRLGHGETIRTVEERILLGIFLFMHKPDQLLAELKPEWSHLTGSPLQEKLRHVQSFYPTGIFPWGDDLSEEMESATFSLSFLIQPDLFIRIRPGHEQSLRKKLAKAAVDFKEVTSNCLAFENGVRLQDILEINREYVVQDYNSQNVGAFMDIIPKSLPLSVWDCCAASGGKSIMAYDYNLAINLVVSDIRPAILNNLHKRFGEAGIKKYTSLIADLQSVENLAAIFTDKQFDLIICDAPCSGSGTWSRTPEQLLYFDRASIDRYSSLQRQIVKNASLFLKPGGYFLYITCSVFKKENEEIASYIINELNLTLKKAELLKGPAIKADTLFAALFKS